MKQEFARDPVSGKVQLHISDLPFSRIPHQSRLFLEYQRDPISIKRFFPNAVASPAEIKSFIPEVIANYHTDRSALCDAVAEINTKAGAGEKTFENIRMLRKSASVAVVTGQQAGLFTGPLYTIYKALSVVKMAADLREQGIAAVSVFWAATEDHDLEEVSEAFFLGSAGELAGVKYSADARFAGKSVGSVKLEASIGSLINGLFETISETKFSGEMKTVLYDAWNEGSGFGDAFIKALSGVLAGFGVIFLDPMHAEIKKLSSSIYTAAIERSDDIVSAIRESSGQLVAEGFHSQVLVEEDYFPLFWHDDDGRRTALKKVRNDVFRAKGGKHEITRAELIEIAKNEPQRLSPGVMLRPVVQDHLLPTACYFGGAAEIAYFAQNSGAYRVLDRPVTPILHRQSFTIVEPKQRKALEKFKLDLPALFDGSESVTLKLAEKNVSAGTDKLFADVDREINDKLDRLDQHLAEIDPSVAANFAKRRRKMIYHIAAIRKKAVLAQLRKDEVASRQIESLFTSLVPNGELQERTLNVFTFLNRFGPAFIEWLYQSIDLEDKEHRIIDL